MATPQELANKARMTLAQALGPLQSADVPEELKTIAAPIAKTMGMLHSIERDGNATPELCAEALDNVRNVLNALQRQSGVHPSVDTAMEAVAGSLSKLFALSKAVRPSSPPAEAESGYQPNAAFATPQQSEQQPAQPAGYQAPAQPGYQAPAQPAQPGYQAPAQPAQPGYQAPAQPAQPGYQAPTAAAQPAPVIGAATPLAQLNATLPVEAAQDQSASAPAPSAPKPIANADAVLVELGAHSGSNFYKGLSGNDVIDHGGLFVATYKIPKLGSSVQLRVCLPGDLEFIVDATVQWTRETRSGESEPGFGAKLLHITPEGRKLVHRYVRNREPIFYDDM